ncbi:hypothetical protein TUMSATVNIG1_22140 [Vibrio nigripulchritudo]|nr:hypothetical protein VNTUMSATTG_21910 [Vibrio nigripulchritudo]BDU31605.1 hypothetical protein TUMSATVNIG1_22140 [Vibrio nigripulchritudo]
MAARIKKRFIDNSIEIKTAPLGLILTLNSIYPNDLTFSVVGSNNDNLSLAEYCRMC